MQIKCNKLHPFLMTWHRKKLRQSNHETKSYGAMKSQTFQAIWSKENLFQWATKKNWLIHSLNNNKVMKNKFSQEIRLKTKKTKLWKSLRLTIKLSLSQWINLLFGLNSTENMRMIQNIRMSSKILYLIQNQKICFHNNPKKRRPVEYNSFKPCRIIMVQTLKRCFTMKLNIQAAVSRKIVLKMICPNWKVKTKTNSL